MTAQGAVVLCGLSQEADIQVLSPLLVIFPSSCSPIQQAPAGAEGSRKLVPEVFFFFFFGPCPWYFPEWLH